MERLPISRQRLMEMAVVVTLPAKHPAIAAASKALSGTPAELLSVSLSVRKMVAERHNNDTVCNGLIHLTRTVQCDLIR